MPGTLAAGLGEPRAEGGEVLGVGGVPDGTGHPEHDARTTLVLKHLETRLSRIALLRALLSGAREAANTYSGTATASD